MKLDMSKLTKKQYAKEQEKMLLKQVKKSESHIIPLSKPVKTDWAKPVLREGYAHPPMQDLWERPVLTTTDTEARVGLARVS